MKAWWDLIPLFWKTYLLSVLFVGGIVLAGEWGEDLIAFLWGNGADASDTQEFIAWILATVPATALGSLLLTRLCVRPLERIVNVVTQMADGDLAARLGDGDTIRTDEIGVLSRTFNGMADRLEHKFENERRLLGAISHELRSPLARMSLGVALLRRETDSGSKTGIATGLDRLELEMGRMDVLVGRLLVYARRETAHAVPRLTDLCEVIRSVARDADFEGRATGRHLRVSMPARCLVSCLPEQMREAIDNVVRNSLRYTPEGGNVDLSLVLRNNESACEFSVRDYGPGVPEDAIEDLFRPFFRVEDSRDRASGGVGLGLSLVEQTIRLHHGRVTAQNAPGGGLLVTMFFPREG